jgi:glutamate-ammonia-ligase adenylyltransferase
LQPPITPLINLPAPVLAVITDPEERDFLRSVLHPWQQVLATTSQANNADRKLAQFLQALPDRAEFYMFVRQRSRTFELLATLFTSSQYLSEILLRHPEYIERLTVHPRLATITKQKTASQFQEQARAALGRSAMLTDIANGLRTFQQWEFLRIGVCDLLGFFNLSTVVQQLSYLADAVLQVALESTAANLGMDWQGLAVLGMGKLGGSELNYSSDIDLLFFSSETSSKYAPLCQKFIEVIHNSTQNGFLYRVDMRLRPWGQVGPLVTTVPDYLKYLTKNGRLWEKQALLKARTVAGNPEIGAALLREVQPLLFTSDPNAVRKEVHTMKQRTEEQLRKKGIIWGEVKLGEGSIRDVEFTTQYLQLIHGEWLPQVRSANTLNALSRLLAYGVLPATDYQVLTEGYVFLRTVEHHLQLLHYAQTHQLPQDQDALLALAERLGYKPPEAAKLFLERYQQHSAAIRAIYRKYLLPTSLSTPVISSITAKMHIPTPSETLLQHLKQLGNDYRQAFSELEISHHAELANRLDKQNLVEVYAEPRPTPAPGVTPKSWQLTVVGYDYIGGLSLICGLLVAYGLDISAGQVFTYHPVSPNGADEPAPTRRHVGRHAIERHFVERSRAKIVDVFSVRSVLPNPPADIWTRYTIELRELFAYLANGERNTAQGKLALRVAQAIADVPGRSEALLPVDIEFDNNSSENTTILRIRAQDTVGFLYELTNALSLFQVNILSLQIESQEVYLQDVLHVTNQHGQKITSAKHLHELKVAIVLVKHFTHLLPKSPDPHKALQQFREFVGQLFHRSNWSQELLSLEQPDVLGGLAKLLGESSFLWEDFLRMQHTNLFPVLTDVEGLTHAKSKSSLQVSLQTQLRTSTDWRDTLNHFKDREMFRIDMRRIQGHTKIFGQFSAELSDLAELVIETAYQYCLTELQHQYGSPCTSQGRCAIVVLALGKMGGRELGFASDIELLVLYSENGQTDGTQSISNGEFVTKLVQQITQSIWAKQAGIFEIDLRLRPYGNSGSMAVSRESFQTYFSPDGPAWNYERQSLVRLRPIAGDLAFGAEICALRDQMLYTAEPFDLAGMRAMRERQLRHLVKPGVLNAKYSQGGLLDVEYLVQGLQITHGAEHPKLRTPNTRAALAALQEENIISAEQGEQLQAAHNFLRRLIDALRVVRGNAKDVDVPAPASEQFAFLARRLDYVHSSEQLLADITYHTQNVIRIQNELFGDK